MTLKVTDNQYGRLSYIQLGFMLTNWPVSMQGESALVVGWRVHESRRSPTPLDGAYYNALLLAHLLVRQELNHVSKLRRSVRF